MVQTTLLYGSDRTLIRDLVQSDQPARTFVDSTSLRLLFSLVVIPICVIAILLNSETRQSQMTLMFGLGYGVASALTPMAWYDFRRKMHFQTFLMFLEKMFFAAAVIAVVFVAGVVISPVLAAALMMTAAVIGILSQWLLIANDVASMPRNHPKQLVWQLKSNFPVVLAALGNMCMTHVNQFILAGLVGKASLAHYTIAFQLTRIVHLFLGQYVRIFAPEIAASTSPDNLKTPLAVNCFWRHVVRALFVATLIATFVFFAGRFAILYFLPPSFGPSIPILFVLCLWCIVFGPATIINRFLLCIHMQNWFLISALVFGILAIILGILLIPQFEGIGVAMSLLIGHASSAIFQGIIVLRRLGREATEIVRPPV